METNKVTEIMREVANFKEIPPNSKFDEKAFWVKIQMELEKDKRGNPLKWVIGLIVAVLIITVAVMMYVSAGYVKFRPPVYQEDIKIQKEYPMQQRIRELDSIYRVEHHIPFPKQKF